jgi:hypothetical protein
MLVGVVPAIRLSFVSGFFVFFYEKTFVWCAVRVAYWINSFMGTVKILWVGAE